MRIRLPTIADLRSPWLIVWLIGIAPVWWLVPVGPKSGWQIPSGHEAICFIDNTTFMTKIKPPPGPGGPRGYASHSLEGTIHYWNVATGELIKTIDWPYGTESAAHVREQYVFAVQYLRETSKKDVYEWRVMALDRTTLEPIWEIQRTCTFPESHYQRAGANSVIFVKEIKKPIYEVTLFDVQKKTELLTFRPEDLRISPTGKHIVSRSKNEYTVYDANTGAILLRFLVDHPTAYSDPPSFCAFSPDGQLLSDSHGRVWNIATGKLQFQFPYECMPFFLADNNSVCAGRSENDHSNIEVFDLASGLKRKEWKSERGHGCSIYAAPDCKWLVGYESSSEGGSVAEWRPKLADATGIRSFANYNDESRTFLFDPHTFELSYIFPGFRRAISPDGRYIITSYSSYFGEGFQVWNIPPRRPIGWIFFAIFLWTIAMLLALRLDSAFRFRFARRKLLFEA